MPFNCGNATLADKSCSSILKYCNNNYATQTEWCNCMISPPNKASCDSLSLLSIIWIAIGGILVLLIIIHFLVHYKWFTKKRNVNRNNNIVIQSTEEMLRPIATRPDRPIPDLTPMSVSIPICPDDNDNDNGNNNNNHNNELVANYKHDMSIPPPGYNETNI